MVGTRKIQGKFHGAPPHNPASQMWMGFLLRWDMLGPRKAASATIPSNPAGESQRADAPVILKRPCNGYRRIQNQCLLMATTILYQIPYFSYRWCDRHPL